MVTSNITRTSGATAVLLYLHDYSMCSITFTMEVIGMNQGVTDIFIYKDTETMIGILGYNLDP